MRSKYEYLFQHLGAPVLMPVFGYNFPEVGVAPVSLLEVGYLQRRPIVILPISPVTPRTVPLENSCGVDARWLWVTGLSACNLQPEPQ